MELAGVLLVTSVLLIPALLLLVFSLMRLRGTTRELQAALDDESGARDRAALLLAIASAVNSSLALEEVLNVALTHAGRIMGAVAGAMYLVQPTRAQLHREAEYNLAHRARGSIRKLDEEPVRTAIAAMRPLVVKLDERTAPGIEGGGHPLHVLVVPVQRSGQLMGAMELYLNAWRELNEDQADLLNGVASQAAIAIRHAQLFQAQEENALTDELTKLPNRRALAQRFLQEMQRARRHHKAISFLMIDLDQFKQVSRAHPGQGRGCDLSRRAQAHHQHRRRRHRRTRSVHHADGARRPGALCRQAWWAEPGPRGGHEGGGETAAARLASGPPVVTSTLLGHFCINCGTALVTRVIEGREVEACPRDNFILWHDPKVSTAVVVEADGGIVLGRRAIEPGYGLWCLPGGFVNDDEDPAAAATRECLEEIKAAVELTGLIGVYHIPKTDAPSMVGIAYRGRLLDGVRPEAGAEMLEVGVFSPDSLPELAFPSHRTVLAEYLKSPAREEAAVLPLAGAAAPRETRPSRAQAVPRRRRTP